MAIEFKRGKKNSDPDRALCNDQLQYLQELRKIYGVEYLSQNLLWILMKNPEKGSLISEFTAQFLNKRLVPFRFTRIQRDLTARMTDRNICLKPRQAGYTTYAINIRLYLPAILEPGTGGLLISQNNNYVNAHFSILKRAHRYVACVDPYDDKKNLLHRQLMQNLLHTTVSNRRELILDQLDSRIVCESAENEEAGQGFTLHHVVCSEVSRWPGNPEETLANLKEAIAAGGTVDIECTPNGMGGYFYEECMRARQLPDDLENAPEFTYHFHPWFWHEEYRGKDPLQRSKMSAEEKEVQEKFQLDLYQMAWRRKKRVSLRHNFKEKYPEDDITCFLTQGQAFFDNEILSTRLRELIAIENSEPFFTGRDGHLVVFKRAKKGRRYLIGADTAKGNLASTDNPDFSTAKCIDLETGEEMFSYKSRIPPEDFGTDLAELGRSYNNAIIAVERTGDGGTVMVKIRGDEHYGNIYKHKQWWQRDRATVVEVEGWPTSVKTRPILLNKLAEFVREHPELIWDRWMVEECLSFIRNPEKEGRPEAAPGSHDDTVFAGAIAQIVRLILLGYLDPLHWKSEKYGETKETEDDSEDAAA